MPWPEVGKKQTKKWTKKLEKVTYIHAGTVNAKRVRGRSL